MELGIISDVIFTEILSKGLLNILPTAIKNMILTYFIFKVLDMGLGLLKTWKNGNYKSRKMRDGIVSWIAELVGIVFVLIIDLILGLNAMLSGVTLALFIYKEAGSILENLLECGVELPNMVSTRLEVFNQKQEKEEEEVK